MRTTDRQLRDDPTFPPTIDEMRWDIAEHEADQLRTKEVIDYLYYGFEGLEHKSEEEVREEWAMLFNEREDVRIEQTCNNNKHTS